MIIGNEVLTPWPISGCLETIVTAPIAGKVGEVCVAAGDDVQAGDLLVSLQ